MWYIQAKKIMYLRTLLFTKAGLKQRELWSLALWWYGGRRNGAIALGALDGGLGTTISKRGHKIPITDRSLTALTNMVSWLVFVTHQSCTLLQHMKLQLT